jgi:hypothetical protein
MRFLLLVAGLIGLIVAAIFQGSSQHGEVMFSVVLFVLVPLGCVIVVGGIIAIPQGKKHLPRAFLPLVKGLLLVGTATIVSCVAGSAIRASQVSAVESFVSRVVVILDGIKMGDGQYPASLPVEMVGNPPRLLRSSDAYFSNGKYFRISYSDAGFWPTSHVFSSHRRFWSNYDPEGFGALLSEESRMQPRVRKAHAIAPVPH